MSSSKMWLLGNGIWRKSFRDKCGDSTRREICLHTRNCTCRDVFLTSFIAKVNEVLPEQLAAGAHSTKKSAAQVCLLSAFSNMPCTQARQKCRPESTNDLHLLGLTTCCITKRFLFLHSQASKDCKTANWAKHVCVKPQRSMTIFDLVVHCSPRY